MLAEVRGSGINNCLCATIDNRVYFTVEFMVQLMSISYLMHSALLNLNHREINLYSVRGQGKSNCFCLNDAKDGPMNLSCKSTHSLSRKFSALQGAKLITLYNSGMKGLGRLAVCSLCSKCSSRNWLNSAAS